MAENVQRDSGARHRNKFFVGRVGPESNNLSLRNYFSSFGEVQIAKVEISKRSGKKKGFGYVVYKSMLSTSELCSKEHFLDGKCVYVDRYEEKPLAKWHNMRKNSIRLHVTEINSKASELQVVKIAEIFGRVLVSNCPRQAPELGYTCNIEIERTKDSLMSINKEGIKKEFDLNLEESWSMTFSHLIKYFSRINAIPKQIQYGFLDSDQLSLNKKSLTKGKVQHLPQVIGQHQKHSKYEFIGRDKSYSDRCSLLVNYRFNINKPSAASIAFTKAVYQRRKTPLGVVMMREYNYSHKDLQAFTTTSK
jgi:RNA recognition motif-containing protein